VGCKRPDEDRRRTRIDWILIVSEEKVDVCLCNSLRRNANVFWVVAGVLPCP